MKKALGFIGGGIAVAVLVVLGLATTQPDSYAVERSRTFDAAPEAVWAQVSDFGNFPKWSPCQKYDTTMKTQIDGKPGEVGHKYSWQGNSDAGSGSMTMTAVKPGERIDIELHFKEPFEDKAATAYILSAEGAGKTKLTWSMQGNNNVLGKLMCVFMSFEEMIGKDYDEGLANMTKVIAPAAAS